MSCIEHMWMSDTTVCPDCTKRRRSVQEAISDTTGWPMPATIRNARHAPAAIPESIAVDRNHYADATAGTKPTNPKDAAATTRLDLGNFPDTALAYGALAMTEGGQKYGEYNYRPAGVQAHVYIAACRRHLAKWWNGEEVDPKTKVPHLANALACIAVLIDAHECAVLVDDRPPVAPVADLLTRFEGIVAHLQATFPDKKARYTEREHGKAAA